MKIKEWLEQAGEPVEDAVYTDPPTMPYILFFDSIQRGGGDLKNLYYRHSLTIERYSQTSDTNEKLEALLDKGAFKYHKYPTVWMSDEQVFTTIYDNIEFFEREA